MQRETNYCDAACCTFEETVCWTLEIFKTATVRVAPTAAVNKRPVPQAMPRPAVIQMALAVVKPLTSPSMSVGLCRARFPFPAVVMTFGGIRGRGGGVGRAPRVDLGRRYSVLKGSATTEGTIPPIGLIQCSTPPYILALKDVKRTKCEN